jgi:hypothetical protein
MANVEQTEFEFPDEAGDKVSRAGSRVMEVEDEKPEIEIVDDTPAADRNRRPMADAPKELSDEELSKYDDSVKKRIQHFTKGYHEERRAKETAQREKDEAIRIAQAIVAENKQLRGSLSEGNNALVEQAKKVVANELADAERKYRAAYEAGDSEALMNAQREMTSATIKADKVANLRPESLQPRESGVQIPPQQASKPVDSKLDAWKSKNDWFGADRKMTAYALGLHEELVENGVQVGSDSYYKQLDVDLQKRFPDRFSAEDNGNETDTVDAKPQRRSNVAPATRSTAPRKIVLSQTQVNTAKRLGVPLELYARKVAELARNQNG